MLSIKRITEAVIRHEPAHYERHKHTREAAVAMILRQRADVTEALFILRASHEGDPWSGHMAFPGGHKEPSDDSIRHTAERETLEEIGLDLCQHAQFIGEIDAVRANPRGRDLDLVVTPLVFSLKGGDIQLQPNYEVADILWGSLQGMYSGDSLTTGEFTVQGEQHRFPGYGVDGQIVWGLTYRMLDQFFGMMDPHWEPREF